MMGDMCGRYVVATPFQQMAIDFGALAELGFAPGDERGAPDYAPDYNVAPTKPVPVVWQRARDERRLSVARWGLVPAWAKDPSVGVRAFNARIETAAEKPTFRGAFAKRRCVLPADGYYEWKKEGAAKQPMYIHAGDGGQLAFAGLYERWTDAEGRELWSVSILTGPAVGPLAEIHDRMPLTVSRDLLEPWLDQDVREPDQVRSLLDLTRAPGWVARPVGSGVGNVRNNGPELIEEISGQDSLF
jgi:putative SOS response-associated peptidase YedK